MSYMEYKYSKKHRIAPITTESAAINGFANPFFATIPMNIAVDISCRILLKLLSSDTSVDGWFRQNTI